MSEKQPWTPDKDEALKKLIRETIESAGAADPSALPHRVKERLKGLATGDLDVDAYVKKVLAEKRRSQH